MKTIKVKNEIIGDANPTFIVAEMAWSHDGSINNAKNIIRSAAEAKANCINFHITSLEDYMVPQYGKGRASISNGAKSLFDCLKNIDLDEREWKELSVYAKEHKLIISTLCNDIPSVKFASKLEPDIYAISPSCISEENLLKLIAEKKKPIFLRVGGTYLGEIEKAVFLIRRSGNDNIALIHGFQNYPTKLEDNNLRFIQSLKKIFGLPVGFGDHTDGGSELALTIPLVALPFGANIIEKHVTHDRSLKGVDFESALDPGDFKRFVYYLREVEKTFGSTSIRSFSENELNYRKLTKKRVVADKDIRKKEVITIDKIAFKRSDEGIYPEESRMLIGRTLKHDIKRNEPITWDKIL